MIRKLLAIFVLLTLSGACAKKEAELILSEQSVTLDYQAGSWLTMVTSGGDWTLSPDEPYDWIAPSRMQGNVGNIISFSVQENMTGDSRSALYRAFQQARQEE